MLLLQLRLLTEPRLASIEEITAVHDADYVQQLQETIETQAPTVVADFDDPDGFTYVTNTSFDDARQVHTPSLGTIPPRLHTQDGIAACLHGPVCIYFALCLT